MSEAIVPLKEQQWDANSYCKQFLSMPSASYVPSRFLLNIIADICQQRRHRRQWTFFIFYFLNIRRLEMKFGIFLGGAQAFFVCVEFCIFCPYFELYKADVSSTGFKNVLSQSNSHLSLSHPGHCPKLTIFLKKWEVLIWKCNCSAYFTLN